jgi:hypothetical protein
MACPGQHVQTSYREHSSNESRCEIEDDLDRWIEMAVREVSA